MHKGEQIEKEKNIHLKKVRSVTLSAHSIRWYGLINLKSYSANSMKDIRQNIKTKKINSNIFTR